MSRRRARRRTSLLLAGPAVLVGALAGAAPAAASCAALSPSPDGGSGEALVQGEVLGVRDGVLLLRVDRVWSGPDLGPVVTFTVPEVHDAPGSSSSERFDPDLPVGSDQLVAYDAATWTVGGCSVQSLGVRPDPVIQAGTSAGDGTRAPVVGATSGAVPVSAADAASVAATGRLPRSTALRSTTAHAWVGAGAVALLVAGLGVRRARAARR